MMYDIKPVSPEPQGSERPESSPLDPELSPLDVVILTWNDPPEMLERAVRSVIDSRGVNPTVTVVDNGSKTPVAQNGLQQVQLLWVPDNRGVAAGRNLGASAGSSPVICFLDSDARLDPACLSVLVQAIRSSETIALTAPVFSGQLPEASAGRAPSLLDKLVRAARLTNRYRQIDCSDAGLREVEFAIGACQVVRRDAFESVGGFDDRFFYGPEDVDLCLRLRRAGWKLVQTMSARCEHPPRRAFRNPLTKRGIHHGLGVLEYALRHRRIV